LDGLQMDVESAAFETKDETATKLLKQIEELHTYVERNQAFIPNYGERYRPTKGSHPVLWSQPSIRL
jgi:hypothetical protein